MLVARN